MGEYGSGLSFAKCCAHNKERIKEALNGRLLSYEDEDGFHYAPASKEECDRFILSAYDNAVYHAREAMASGRAMERLHQEQYPDKKIDFLRYIALMEEETLRDRESHEYCYESDGSNCLILLRSDDVGYADDDVE